MARKSFSHQSFVEQARVEDAICRAPNGKALNALLPEGVAVLNRGKSNRSHGQWAFTVNGNCVKTGDFADVKMAAADWMVADWMVV